MDVCSFSPWSAATFPSADGGGCGSCRGRDFDCGWTLVVVAEYEPPRRGRAVGDLTILTTVETRRIALRSPVPACDGGPWCGRRSRLQRRADLLSLDRLRPRLWGRWRNVRIQRRWP